MAIECLLYQHQILKSANHHSMAIEYLLCQHQLLKVPMITAWPSSTFCINISFSKCQLSQHGHRVSSVSTSASQSANDHSMAIDHLLYQHQLLKVPIITAWPSS